MRFDDALKIFGFGYTHNPTAKEVKSKYRELALKYHPDRNPGDKEAEHKMKRLNEAVILLSDVYDKKREWNIGDYIFIGVSEKDLGRFKGYDGSITLECLDATLYHVNRGLRARNFNDLASIGEFLNRERYYDWYVEISSFFFGFSVGSEMEFGIEDFLARAFDELGRDVPRRPHYRSLQVYTEPDFWFDGKVLHVEYEATNKFMESCGYVDAEFPMSDLDLMAKIAWDIPLPENPARLSREGED